VTCESQILEKHREEEFDAVQGTTKQIKKSKRLGEGGSQVSA
jgi:hypothetical protein